jgi:4-alpha-glucanotransferase
MGLQRLFWIPQGFGADDGVYVRYPVEELCALLTLESHRHEAMIVGEDLGTVPSSVRAMMARHEIHRTYVVQYEVAPGRDRLPLPPRRSVAAVNSHDMPTFAGFWNGFDVDDRLDLGLLSESEAKREHRERSSLHSVLLDGSKRGGKDDQQTALRRTLQALGRSDARIVQVNLEDLWGETQPQNVPGTSAERPNWRRAARYSLEEMRAIPEVTDTLAAVDAARRERRRR